MARIYDFKNFSDLKLLQLQAAIIDNLRKRGVVRTRNNPISDYGEYLVAKKLKLQLAPSSTKSYDAFGLRTNIKYQVKVRRLTKERHSRQLGVIRNLKAANFKFLIVVIFNEDFTISKCYKIPKGIIAKYARYSRYQNGHILIMRGLILQDKNVKEINLEIV